MHASLLVLPQKGSPVEVNDVHSQMNPTLVRQIVRPRSEAHLVRVVREAIARGEQVSVCGARYAMGGQQFRAGTTLIDMTALKRVRRFSPDKGIVDVEAGMNWPELIGELEKLQPGSRSPWTIRQKQTGADALTLGGAVGANIHGRGLSMAPFVSDINEVRVLTPRGQIERCSRTENEWLFRLVVGGYGLFGIVVSVALRLARRQVLRRRVAVISRDELIPSFTEAIARGAVYGDFQFSCDDSSPDFLSRGVLSVYEPSPASSSGAPEIRLSANDWRELLFLAHARKGEAFERYAAHYLRTDGQTYASDRLQLSTYLPGYHSEIDRRLGSCCAGSEVITEVSVPFERLPELLAAAATHLRASQANVIYGTVRLIEEDRETFLPWARGRFACVIFNLHGDHGGSTRLPEQFRGLIDIARSLGGTFYLTYHRYATKRQLLAVYPQLPYLLAAKRGLDPAETFTSEWYEYYRAMFEEEIAIAEGDQRPERINARTR